MMKRKGFSISIVMLLIFGSFLVVNVTWDIVPKVEAKTWYVDDIPGGSPSEDFVSIQDAVDAASDGDTIYVYSGVYYEHVVISLKSIILTGENRDTTIINGSGAGYAIYIDHGPVTIEKFSIINANTGIAAFDLCTIRNNRIQFMDWYGIFSGWFNQIYNNIISNCDTGINTADVNTIKNNVINNGNFGIYIVGSYNFIDNNQINAHEIGLEFEYEGWTRNTISQNNTINGETVYHFFDVHGTPASPIIINNLILDNANISNSGKITLVDCSYFIIEDNVLSNNLPGSGLFSYSSENIIIRRNDINNTGSNNNTGRIGIEERGGILLFGVNNIEIFNNTITNNKEGIFAGISFSPEEETINLEIDNNNISYNTLNGIHLYNGGNNGSISNNDLYNNGWGITFEGSSSTNYVRSFDINKNTLIGNDVGMILSGTRYNTIQNNIIKSCVNIGLKSTYYNRYNNYFNNTIESDGFGIEFDRDSDNQYENNTISGDSYDLYFSGSSPSYVTLLNCSFNKSKTYYSIPESTLTVRWYFHVFVTNLLSQPILYIPVCIKDKLNSLPTQTYETDSEGYVHWLVETEYTEQDANGDNIGEKTYYTPHKITAWNETLLGFSEVVVNESKEVNVILVTPSYDIPLYKGWNLISLPLAQLDTSISSVLSSIAGNYNKVEWYNTSEGLWHTTYDDLTDLDHTMGFWIHMKTDDILTVNGTIPNTTSIQLYKGWNMVGNPKFCNWDFNEILISIEGNYTAIQWYDASDKTDPWKHFRIDKPQGMNDLRYMTSGRGYWIHVNQDCVWDLSNF